MIFLKYPLLKKILIFFNFFILISSLNSVEKSFVLVDKGDIQKAQKLDPDIGWDEGYGFDAVDLDYYNPSAEFNSGYTLQIYATDVIGNKIVYSIGDNDTDDYGKKDGQVTFLSPHGIAGHRDGSVWVADTGNNRVVKLTCDGYEMKYDNVTITNFNQPWGVEVDDAGNVYVADKGSNRIYKYDKLGNPLNDFNGTNYFIYLDNINGSLSNPLDVAIDKNGNIFVVDSEDRLSMFLPNGNLSKSIRLQNISISNGKAESVDVDKYGNVYLLEKNNRFLIKLDCNLNYIDHFGGIGEEDYMFEADVNSISVYGKRGGVGVSTDYGGKLYRIGPGLHDTILNQIEYSPYEGELQIKYKITSESSIEILVLNDIEDVVRTITSSDFQNIGEHIEYWDGKDMLGNYVSNGDYAVKIVAHTAVETPFGQEIELPFKINYTARIDLISANPDVITSTENISTLKYDLSEECKPIINIMKKDVFDPNDVGSDVAVFHDPAESETKGTHYKDFNGKDNNGNDLPDYLYYYLGKVDGSNSPPDYVSIGIDKMPVVGEIKQIEDYYNPNNGLLNIIYQAAEDCYLSIDLLKNNIKVLSILNKQGIRTGVNSYQWNGKEEDGDIIDEDEYVIRLLFEDITKNSSKIDEKKIYINPDAPYIKDLFVSPLVFASSIYEKQNATLYYSLEDKFYDYTLIEIPTISIKLYNKEGIFIKDILSEQYQKPGKYSYTWDGTGSDNISFVPDGEYYFEIKASDNTNNSKTYKQIVIKNTVISEIKSPIENETLNTNQVNITGTAMNLLSFKCFTLNYATGKIEKDKINDTDWKSIKVVSELRSNAYPENTSVLQVQDGLMSIWDTTGLNKGTYTVKLSVYDRDNRSNDILRIVNIDNPIYIANYKSENSIITPNGDGSQDNTKLFFDLSKNAGVKADIYNSNGTKEFSDDTLIRNINLGSLNETLISGSTSHYFIWDGKNNSGEVQNNGQYRIELTATHLLIEKDTKNIIIGIQIQDNSSITASIDSINDIATNNDKVEVSGKNGAVFSYKAKFSGQYKPPKKVKLLLSVKGINTKKTIDVPVYGGPYIIDNTIVYSDEWDGVINTDFYQYIDVQGKPVNYDSPLSCILDGGNVSQVTGFNTIGETSGQLKIFYQNIADLSNAPKKIATEELSEDERNAFALIEVNIDHVDSFTSGFKAGIFNEPHYVNVEGFGEFTMGTVNKIWYYADAPVTYYGEIPYNDSIQLIGEINKDEANSFVLKTLDGKVITDNELKNIILVSDSVINKEFSIIAIGVADNIDSNDYFESPSLLQGINPYFESKVSISLDKNKTLLYDDKIILETYPSDWNSSLDKNLEEGYFYGPDYIFDLLVDKDEKSVNIPYMEPAGVTLFNSGTEVVLLDNDGEVNKNFNNPISIESKSFKVTPANDTFNNKLLNIRGSIVCENLDYYLLSCYDNTGNKVYEKKYNKLYENRLGVIDFTDQKEGEYTLTLDIFAGDGDTKKISKKIIFVDEFNPEITSLKSENQKLNINYSLNEESVITLEIIDSITGEVIKTLVENTSRELGLYEESWNGFDDNGTPFDIEDDSFLGFKEYKVRLTAQDKDFIGTEYQKAILEKNVILEDIGINAEISVSSDILSPDGDGINDFIKIIYTVNEPFSIDIDILDKNNEVIRNVLLSYKGSPDQYEAFWDGKDNNQNLVGNGYYKININVTPLDGGASKVFQYQIEVKSSVTVNPSVLSITYPNENEIISSTAGTLFTYTARAKGNYYPPQTFNYTIYRDGLTNNTQYKTEKYSIKKRKGGDFWTYYKTFTFDEPGWKLMHDTEPDKDEFESSPSGGHYYYPETHNHEGSDSIYSILQLQQSRPGQTLNYKGHLDVDWERDGYTNWTKSENGNISGVTIQGKDVEIPANLTLSNPIKPSNLIDTSEIKYGNSYWNSGQYINVFPEGSGEGTRISGNKFRITSNIHESWIDAKYFQGFNYPIIFDEREFNPDTDENSYTVNIYALNSDAKTELDYLNEDVDLNGWNINITSPNETAYIINQQGVTLENPKQITNDNTTVTVGTSGIVNENGKFKVILDKNKEKKFLKIKGRINTEINSFKVFVSPGRNIEDAIWQKVFENTGKPQQIENGDYIFYTWDVTNLYGPYMILVRVERDSGMVELTRKVKLGNRVTRGVPSIASSPYKKAILGFPPLAIPEGTQDDDPSTPKIDVIADIIPISADNINHNEEGMSIVGPVFDMKPSGIKFNEPVTLQYRYTDNELQTWADELNISVDRLESRLGSYHLYKDEDGNEKLEYMPGYIDKQNNVLTVMIYGFSKYALVYDDNTVPKPVFDKPGLYSKYGYIDLSGKTEVGYKVKIYLNGTDQEHFRGYADVSYDGTFIFKEFGLGVGLNKIYAIAINNRDILSDASLIEINYDFTSPEINISKIENDHFSPNDDGVKDNLKVKFSLNEDGRIQYVLNFSSGNTIKTGEILTSKDKSEEFVWDGKVNGILQSEGEYLLILSAYDNAGNYSLYNRDNIINIKLDNTPAEITRFEVNDDYFSPNNDDLKDNCLFVINTEDNLSEELYYDLKLYNNNDTLIKNVINYEKANTGTYAKIFPDEDSIADGEYKAKLKVYDLAGNESIIKNAGIYVDTTPPAPVSSIKFAYQYFSPNGDQKQDNLPLYFDLNKDADVYITVFDLNDNILNNIKLENFKGKRSHIYSYDGRDDKGVSLVEGNYKLNIFIVDKYGNNLTKDLLFTIDNTPPVININQPSSGATLSGIIDILGTANDTNFDFYTIEIKENANLDFIELNRSYNKIDNNILYNFDTGLLNGLYDLKIAGYDKAGNSNSSAIQINFNNTADTSFLFLSVFGKDVISPVNNDETNIIYSITKDSEITINLKFNENIIRTFKEDESHTAAKYLLKFNGKDENGNNYTDGKYRFEVKAKDISTNVICEKYIDVWIDTQPPQLNITEPVNNSFIKNILSVKGNIIEENLRLAYLEYGLGPTPERYILLNEIRETGNNIYFGQIDTKSLLNDIYTFRVTVIDKAGIKVIQTRTYNIDNNEPGIEFITPVNNDIVGNNDLQVEANINDTSSINYSLEYKLDAGDTWNIISNGTINKAGIVTGILSKELMTENFDIRLTATDSAGNVSTKEINLIVDNKPPVVDITEPIANSFVGQSVSIKGTVNDDNLDNFIVYLGKGINPASYEQIYQGFTNIENDTIYILDALELAGEYTIKIEAIDQSGRISTDTVSFKIDITGPSVKIIAPKSGFYSGIIDISSVISDDNEVSEYTLLFGEGENPLTYTELYKGNGVVNGIIYTWDTSLLDGEYTLLLKAKDNRGNEAFDKVVLNFDNTAPVINELKLSEEIFHPLSPISNSQLSMNISENSYITLEIFDSQDNSISKVLDNFYYEKGGFSFTLTGKINDYTILPDGNYKVKIKAKDEAGNMANEEISFKLFKDIQPPAASIISVSNYYFSPNNDGVKDNTEFKILISDNSDNEITVKCNIINTNFEIIKNYDEVTLLNGEYNISWNGQDDQNNSIPDGIYTLRIKLIDKLGNKNEFDLTKVTIDTIKPIVSNIIISQHLISPNFDGIKDYTQNSFDINENAFIDFDIYYNNNNKVYSLSSNRLYAAGNYKFLWAGEGYIGDGEYKYIIKYTDPAGNSGIEKEGIIKVDNTPPILSLEELPEYIKGNAELKGSINEANLTEYKVYYRNINSSDWIILNQSANYPVNNIIGNWDTSSLSEKEGYYLVKFSANDNAGLSSTIEKLVRVDNELPVVDFDVLEEPYHNINDGKDYYKGFLTFKADIKDTFLYEYKLYYIDNITNQTKELQLLTDGISNVEDKIIAKWDTADLDSNYTIRLVAKDKSGNITTLEKIYNIDSVRSDLTNFNLSPVLISPENQDNNNDISISTFNINEDSNIKSKIISSNILYNWQAIGEGKKTEYTDQNVNFTLNVNGKQTVYPEQTFDYRIEFEADEAFEEFRSSKLSYPSAISVNQIDGSVWITDSVNNQVVKLDSNGNELLRKGGFVSPNGISVNQNDGSVWIIDFGNSQVVKLDSNGNELVRKDGFINSPNLGISVNSNDGSVWISDRYNDQVVKLNSDGGERLQKSGFNDLTGISVNYKNNNVWIADTYNNQVVKLDSNGNELLRKSGFTRPWGISVNQDDGSVWITNINNEVIKLDLNGNELLRKDGFNQPYCISVNPIDGSVWITDIGSNQVVKLDSKGNELLRKGGFANSTGISVNQNDGSVWIADTYNSQVVKLDSNGNELVKNGGFIYPMGFSSLNQTDDSIWINDASGQVVKLALNGIVLVRIGGFNQPNDISGNNPTDGSVWIADTNNSQVVKLDSNGNELVRKSGFKYPHAISVNSTDGSVWIADTNNSQVVKLDSNGNELVRKSGLRCLYGISVNPTDGSVWIADTNNSQVVKLDSNGNELVRKSGFILFAITVNPTDGSVWIANNQVVKLDSNGNELVRKGGFYSPRDISVNPTDGSVWITDTANNQVVKLDSNGNELVRKGGFNYPFGILVNATDGSVWIADTYNKQVVKLSKSKFEKHTNKNANAGINGNHKNLYYNFKNYILSQNITGQFKVNGTTSTPVPAYLPGTFNPHPYVKIYLDNKDTTSDIMDDEIIAYVEESIPETKNPDVPWNKPFEISNITVNAKNPVIIDIPDELLVDGFENDPNGNPSTFDVTNLNNPNVNIEIKQYTEGLKAGRHYLELIAKPETVIVDNEWKTPLLQGNSYMVTAAIDNSHNIFNESGYVLPVSGNVDITIDKWQVNLTRYNGNEEFDGAYVVERDAQGYIYSDDFTVRASGGVTQIKEFNEYSASAGLVNNPIDDWDGTGQGGNVYVPDGDYLYFIEVFDKAGNRSYAMKNINVDNTPPVVSMNDFSDVVYEPLSIIGSAYDTNRFGSYELKIFDNDTVIKNITKNNPISDSELYFWDPTGLVDAGTKDFRVVLTAFDEALNKSELEKSITIGKIDSVITLYSNLQYISPQNTSIEPSKRKASIDFKLLSDANLSIVVYDNSNFTGTPVRSILAETTLSSGEYVDVYSWDGRDNSNQYVPDARYYIKLEASAISNPDIKTTRRLDVVVDSIINLARIDSPVNNQFIDEELVNINASIDEKNLLYYSLSYKKESEDNSKFIEVFKSNSSSGFPLNNKKIFEFIIPPAEDNYDIRLMVEDLAGNKSTDIIRILKDNIAPVVKLELDKGYNYNDTKIVNGVINISGTVFDNNIKNYKLSIQKDASITELASGTSNINNSIIVSGFNTALYNDGDYSLILEAEDNNNHKTTVIQNIRIDNTSPVITIISPITNSFIKGIINIDFDVNEYLPDDYSIEYCNINTPNEWHNIISAEYNEGITNNWNTGTLNGEFTLKIKVTDKAGNSSEKSVNIIIDNILPSVLIKSPLTAEILEGIVVIRGIANDTNLEKGTLSYKKTDGSTYTEFASFDTASTLERDLGTLNGASLEDGKYNVKLFVKDKAGNTNENEIDILIDNHAPIISISSPIANSVLEKTFDITGTINDFTLANYKVSIGEGLEPLEYEVINQGNVNINNGLIYSFNSNAQSKIFNGQYIIKIEANDKMDRTTSITIPVFIDNIEPDITNLTVKYQSYSPYDDEQVISFDISEKANIFVNIKDDSDKLIKEIANNLPVENKNIELKWDGNDINGNYLPNGDLKVIVYAVDSTGKKSLEREVGFEYFVDNVSPVISDISATPKFSPNNDGFNDYANIFFNAADNISDKLKVSVYIYDASDNLIYTITENNEIDAGNTGYMWFGKNLSDVVVNNGTYYAKIKLVDSTGNETELKTGSIIVDNTKPEITNILLQPEIISPDNNGNNDTLTLSFNVSDNNESLFNIKVSVLDEFDNILKVIYESNNNNNLTYSANWNGRNTSNEVVSDGIYKIRIEVWDDVSNKNENLIECRTDITLPQIIIHSTEQVFVPTDEINSKQNYLYITGHIYDANLKEYNVYYSKGNSNEWNLIYTGTENQEAIDDYWPELVEWDINGLNGLYKIKVEAIDLAGSSISVTIEVNIDTFQPESILILKDELYNNYYTNVNNEFTFSVTDPVGESYSSGIDKIYYQIDNGDFKIYTNEPIKFNEHGIHIINYFAIDKAGNVEEQKTKNIFVDSIIPIINFTQNGIFFNINDKLYGAGTNTYVIEASDVDSGLKGIYYSLNDIDYNRYDSPVTITFNMDGEKSIKYYAKDNVDNTTDAYSYTVIVDSTAPVTNITSDKEILIWNNINYAEQDIKFKLSSVDELSGVKTIHVSIDESDFVIYDGSEIGLTNEGEHTIRYYSVDNVENTEEIKTLKVTTPLPDRTPPVTTIKPTGFIYTANDGKLYAYPSVGFELTAEDIIGQNDGYATGVNYTEYRIDGSEWTRYVDLIYLNEGIHTIEYRSYDMIPNIEEIKIYEINIDNTPPQTTDNYQHKETWINSDAEVTLSSIDLIANEVSSGVKNIKYKINGTETVVENITATFNITTEGITKIQYQAIDNVGNIENAKDFEIKIDKTLPVIDITGVIDQKIYGKEGVTPIIAVSDLNLDIVTITISKNGSAGLPFTSGTHIEEDGQYLLKVMARDLANNISSKNISFSIDLTPPEDIKNISYLIIGNEILFNWDKVNNINMLGYNIYRNGEKLNTVILEENKFIDNPGFGKFIYKVTVVDDLNNESKGKEVTIIIDNTLQITDPDPYDYFNYLFLLIGKINNNKVKKIYVDYARYENEDIIPAAWTNYRSGRNMHGRFIVPVITKSFEDGKYIFRVKAALPDGTTREVCIRINIDNTKPNTRLYISEAGQYYEADEINDEIKEIKVSLDATVSFDTLDPVINDVASGIKYTKYKIIRFDEFNKKYSFKELTTKLFSDWKNWNNGDNPIKLLGDEKYIVVFYSADKTKPVENKENLNIIKLVIEKIKPENETGHIENYNDAFAGMSLIKPPVQDYKGRVIINYPIITSPAISEIQPDLKLIYNNESKESDFGSGWDLNILSITQDEITGTCQLKYDNENILMFMTDIDGEYKLRSNNEFIQFNNYQDYWKAIDREGKEYYFGIDESSRDLNNGKERIWMLNKVVDKNGNYIEYNYTKNNNNIKLINIQYAGNNNVYPYYNIDIEYNYYNIDIIISAGNEYIRKYKLITEINNYTNNKILKQISEYGCDGVNFTDPYITDIEYLNNNNLISIINPIKGKINIEYSKESKMSNVEVYNDNEILFIDSYKYFEKDEYYVVEKFIDKKNYTMSYYYSDNLKKGILYKINNYINDKLFSSFEYSWELVNEKIVLTREKIITNNKNKPENIIEIIYHYDELNNIIKIDYVEEGNNLSYLMEYTIKDINGYNICKLIHTYKVLNNDGIRHNENYYYYDNLEYGEIQKGNLTKIVNVSKNGLENNEKEFEYNKYGKIIKINNNNEITNFNYEEITNNYIKHVIISSGDTIESKFNIKTGYILQYKDNNNTFNYVYDNNNRLIKIKSTGNEWFDMDIKYNLNRKNPKIILDKKIDNKTLTTELTFDGFGRILDIKYPDGNKIIYYYSNGMLKSVSEEKFNNIFVKNIEYDNFKRRLGITYGNNNYKEYDLTIKNIILSKITEPNDLIDKFSSLNIFDKYPINYEYFNQNNDKIIKFIYDLDKIIARVEGHKIIWMY